MNSKKILSILFSALLLLGMFACSGKNSGDGEGTDAEATAGGTASAGTTAAGDETGEKQTFDFDGAAVRFAMSEFDNGKWIRDIFVTEEDADATTYHGKAILERNAAVSAACNVELSYVPVNGYDEQAVLRNSIMTGLDEYDVMMPHANISMTMAQLELFFDWNELPGVNLDADYWNQDARANLSINNRLYIMTGDISYLSVGLSDVMLFNKKLMDDIGEAYPYEEVREGDWTFDRFSQLVKKGGGDLNGDSVISAEDDRMGYVTQMYVGPIQAFYSGGQRVLAKDDRDMPYFNFFNDTTLAVFEAYFALTDSEDAYVQKYGNSWDGDFITMFREDRALFVDINMYDLVSLRSMNSEFGILPWPKFSEGGAYCSNVDAGLHMICIPLTNTHLEMTSAVLDMLCAISGEKVIPAYYETAVQTKFARDDDSRAMLDIIKASRVFDLGYYNCYYSEAFHAPFLPFVTRTDRGFAGWYDENLERAQVGLDDLVDTYR